jgi:uncharacterized protein (TIGR03086 family)
VPPAGAETEGGIAVDVVDLFDRGSAWTKSKIEGARDSPDAKTPCAPWTVRDVVNHLIDVQSYFQHGVRGEDATTPSSTPPDAAGDDPAAAYESTRQATLDAFRTPEAADRAAMLVGLAFVDTVVHGTDIAKATGQDAKIPSDLAEAALGMVDGKLTAENRGDKFKPPLAVPDDASAHDKLLAYMGRKP